MFFRTSLILASLASFVSASGEIPRCSKVSDVTFSEPSCFFGKKQNCRSAPPTWCGEIRVGIRAEKISAGTVMFQQLGIDGKPLVDIDDVSIGNSYKTPGATINTCAVNGPQLAKGTYEILVIIDGKECRTGYQIAYGNGGRPGPVPTAAPPTTTAAPPTTTAAPPTTTAAPPTTTAAPPTTTAAPPTTTAAPPSPTDPTPTAPAPTPTGGPEGGSGEQGGGKRRRRLSAAANLVTPQDQVYQAHLDKCGEHEYDVSIYVDPAPHTYAILEPKSATTECPHGATHSIHYADGSYNKEILTFDTKADYQEMFEQEAFPIGTFTLAELEQAFQKIDFNSNHAYNVVENNCGMYLAKLGSELGVKVDHKMVSFVTRRLIENSSKDLMDSIRKSAGALFQGRGLRAAVTDKDIVELLVQDSAADVLA